MILDRGTEGFVKGFNFEKILTRTSGLDFTQLTIFLFLIMAAILDGIWTNQKKLRMGTHQVLFLPSFVQIGSFISENKIFFFIYFNN